MCMLGSFARYSYSLLTYIEPVLRVQLGVVMFAVADESLPVAWYTVPNPDFIAVLPRFTDNKMSYRIRVAPDTELAGYPPIFFAGYPAE